MNVIGRVAAVFTGGLMVASIIGAIAARAAKRQIVPVEAPDADEVRLTAFFEPMSFRSTAGSFRGGTIDCWYGGGVIDLRDATLDPAGARLEVRAILGGGQILVPDAWRVSSKIVGVGGLVDGRPRVELAEDAPHLTIEGIAILGGFGVVSDILESEARGLSEAVTRFGDRRHPASNASPRVEATI
jgi:hypothetical protein